MSTFIEVYTHPEKTPTTLAVCDIQSVHPTAPPAWKAPDINDLDAFTLYGVTYARTKEAGRVPFWRASAINGTPRGDYQRADAVPLFDEWLSLNTHKLQQRHDAAQFRGTIVRLRNGEVLPVAHAYEDLSAALNPIRVSVLP